MLKPSYAKQFERDANLAKRRGKNLDKLKAIIDLICNDSPRDFGVCPKRARGVTNVDVDSLLIASLRTWAIRP
jgi:hypothetical protein